jgi:uncharacterized membrane-anchored protein
MKYFKVVVACGHVGFGREIDVARFFEAPTIDDAMHSAMWMPRVKRKGSMMAINLIKEIPYDEYIEGKKAEEENLYLKKGGIKKCAVAGGKH